MYDNKSPKGVIAAVIALLVGIGGLWIAIDGLDKTGGGEVAVVRNGGPFDNNKIYKVIQPASGLTWTGMFSDLHRYPAQQRYYTITADPGRGDRAGVDVVNVPSSDGVAMGVEGTVYFTLNLDDAALKEFDNKFGTRTFAVTGKKGERLHAWESDEGWSAFLDSIVRPVIDNALRIQVNNFRCAELVSSCALVQNQIASQTPATDLTNGQNNTVIAKVQAAINSTLATDMQEMLGGKFFEGIKFNLSKVELPKAVQDAVNKAQAAYAAVSESQAKVKQAEADALANQKRQEGYNACPACAQIDIIKALPPGVTTYAPGAGTSVPLK